MPDITNYLGIPHTYGKFDCIILVKEFYLHELGISLDIPAYSFSRRWLSEFSVKDVDLLLNLDTIKVHLTDLKNYDLIVFKSANNNINHFGLYIHPHKLLHVEEGKCSKIDQLTSLWINRLHGIYRHKQLV